jgi:hypothetical protein
MPILMYEANFFPFCYYYFRNFEDFVTWTDTSAIRKHVLEYNEMVSYKMFSFHARCDDEVQRNKKGLMYYGKAVCSLIPSRLCAISKTQ